MKSLLLDEGERRRLFAELDGETGGHLPLTWRMSAVLMGCELDDSELRRLFQEVPEADFDSKLGDLVCRQDFPTDLLLQLIATRRLLTPIAHRVGPREVLEAVSARYPFDEPVRTLIARYYSRESWPLESLLAFVTEHGHKLERRSLEDIEMSESRRLAVLRCFDGLLGS